MASNISIYNAKVDRSLTQRVLGRNGIMYEFELPYGANPSKYYEEALNVKSVKGNNKRRSRSKNNFGKIYRPGTYQPVGDKRYFNYYQLNKMTEKDWDDWYIELLIKEELSLLLKAGLSNE